MRNRRQADSPRKARQTDWTVNTAGEGRRQSFPGKLRKVGLPFGTDLKACPFILLSKGIAVPHKKSEKEGRWYLNFPPVSDIISKVRAAPGLAVMLKSVSSKQTRDCADSDVPLLLSYDAAPYKDAGVMEW